MNGLYDELRIALHSVWKRRWLALAVCWAIALAGWLVISLIPNSYESQARVLVRAQTLLPDASGTANERMQTVDQIRQTLTSTVALEKVVRGTDLALQAANDRDVTDLANALTDQIRVTAEQDNLFQISALSGDRALSDAANAKLARQIAQKLVDLFVDGSLAGTASATGKSLKFIDAQLAERGKQLAEAEAKRAAFEAKFMALLPGTGTIGDRIAAARSEIVRIDSDLASARSGLAAVNAQMASTPASTRTPGAMIAGTTDPNAGAIAQVQAQIADGLARGWTDQHPDIVVLRSQLSRLRATGGGGGGARAGAAIVTQNPMYVSLRSMQAEKQAVAGALASRKAQLESQINGVLASQAANPQVAAEQTELDRAYAVLKGQYDKLLADREEVKLRGDVQSADSGKFSVIDPPSAPRIPATPNRPLLLTMVLLAALAGGAGAAFVMGQLQHSYPTASRLASATGLPVLGSIHDVLSPAQRADKRRKLKWFGGGAAALMGTWVVLLIAEFVQRSMVA
ncbi:MAG: XrtA system polysaccharide chain length determinant [Sphingomonadaceae bacterium]